MQQFHGSYSYTFQVGQSQNATKISVSSSSRLVAVHSHPLKIHLYLVSFGPATVLFFSVLFIYLCHSVNNFSLKQNKMQTESLALTRTHTSAHTRNACEYVLYLLRTRPLLALLRRVAYKQPHLFGVAACSARAECVCACMCVFVSGVTEKSSTI